MKSSRRIFAGMIAALLVIFSNAGGSPRAELRIDITSGKIEPMPIAIPPFPGGAANESQAGRRHSGRGFG